MKYLNSLFLIALIELCTCLPAAGAPVDPNFAVDNLQFGFGKTKVEFDFAGRMYVTEKQGRVLLFTPDGSGGFNAPGVLLDIVASVDPELESGLLGFELDPDHAINRFIYLFYTTSADQRLVRYTMNAAFNGVEAGSELILLSGLPRFVNFHKAGDIGIRPGDPYAIYVALGDDERLNRAQDLDFYEGKFLRVDTSTGLGLPDNPFFDGDVNSIRSRIWARGFRNPFRFVFHPTLSDVILVSENGDAKDRIAWVKRGSNGEWGPGGDYDGFLDPDDPNFRVMNIGGPSYVGITVVMSGPFAYNGQPTLYLGNWYPNTTGVRRFTLSGADLDTLTPIPDGSGGDFWEAGAIAVDLELGADGHLYYTETNGDAAAGPGQDFYGLRRYRYAGGAPPSGAFTVSATSGEAPLLATFTDWSTSGSNPITDWEWDFGDGNSSALEDPSHLFGAPGIYTVCLTVTDTVGLVSSTLDEVMVTDTTAITFDLDLLDGRSLPESPISTTTDLAFYQLDGATPLAFAGGTGPEGNRVNVPGGGQFDVTLDLPLTADGFVLVAAENDIHGFQPREMALPAVPGSPSMLTREICLSDTAVSGRVLTVSGNPAVVDIGVHVSGSPLPFGGGRDYLPGFSFPATGVGHRTVSDMEGYYYLPLPTATGGMSALIETTADTNRDRYTSASASVALAAETGTRLNLDVGEWRGGTGKDDLSGIPVTPNVDFDDVQAVFSANCTGCHRANTTNNGGLDLTVGNSFAELVSQPSLFVGGLLLVEPGNPSRSYLFEKINSALPQQGSRMRPSDDMSPADQALIRDWIAQLEPTYESYLLSDYGAAPGDAGTALGEDFNGDGVSNGFDYTQVRVGEVSADASQIVGEFEMSPTVSGLTLTILASETLKGGSWRTIAVKPRGSAVWTTASGVSVTEPSPGLVRFTDDTHPSRPLRFYKLGFREF